MSTRNECSACRAPTLRRASTFRSGHVLACFGFVAWAASIGGFLAAAALLGVACASTTLVDEASRSSGAGAGASSRAELAAPLADAGVPEDVLEAFRAGRPADEFALRRLSPEQRGLVRDADSRVEIAAWSAEEATELVGLFAVVFTGGLGLFALLASVVLLAIGWLLVRKRPIWKCGTCGHVEASGDR